MIEESIRLFGELGDERGTALAVGSAGIAAVSEKRYEEGIALLEEAGSLYRKLGDEWGLTAVLVSAAGAWLALGDHGRAQQTAGEGLALARKPGDRTGISIALHVLATPPETIRRLTAAEVRTLARLLGKLVEAPGYTTPSRRSCS